MSNKFETEEDYEFGKGESQRELSQYQPFQGLSDEDKPPLLLKQYGVNDLSPVSETPVFTERMKWFAQQLKDHNVPEHIADAMMNPIHGNQAGFEAANKAMEEIEKAEIEKEAVAYAEKINPYVWPKNKQGEEIVQRVGQNAPNSAKHRKENKKLVAAYAAAIIAERSRLHPLLLHSESKNKESVRLLELAAKELEAERESNKLLHQSMKNAEQRGLDKGNEEIKKYREALEKIVEYTQDFGTPHLRSIATEALNNKQS